VVPQCGHREEGEVAAAASQSPSRRARFDKWSRIGGEQAVEDLVHGAKVAGSRLSGTGFVDQKALNGCEQAGNRGR
jgi:hypothetical protein